MKRFIDTISNVMMSISCISLGLCVLANAYEIVVRYLFGKSLYWIQDFTLLMMLWFIFLGIVKVTHSGTDIMVDFFVNRMPPRIQRLFSLVTDFVVTLFSLLLFYFSLNLFAIRAGQSKVTSGIPLNVYTLAISVSMGLLSIVYIEKMVRQWRVHNGRVS